MSQELTLPTPQTQGLLATLLLQVPTPQTQGLLATLLLQGNTENATCKANRLSEPCPRGPGVQRAPLLESGSKGGAGSFRNPSSFLL